MGERSFFADTPSAETADPPADLGMVAEEVALGLQLSIAGLKNRAAAGSLKEQSSLSRNLDQAINLFARFIEDCQRVGWTPSMEITGRPVQGFKLGLLPGEVPALFDPVDLPAPEIYPINYIGRHFVPLGYEARDSLPGSQTSEQWYLGAITPDIGSLDGYAISVCQFNKHFNDGLIFSAQRNSAEIQA